GPRNKAPFPSGVENTFPPSRVSGALSAAATCKVSGPTHLLPSHSTITRSLSLGRPLLSTDALFHKTRLLFGQENVQFECTPIPVSSVLSRRSELLPSSVITPEYNPVTPDDTVPGSALVTWPPFVNSLPVLRS